MTAAFHLLALCVVACSAKSICDVVTDCGAVADNFTDATASITLCAQQCSVVVFPPNSSFRVSSIDLSNTTGVTLAFGKAAGLFASNNPDDFPLQPALPPQGPVLQWRAVIYARNTSGLTIMGSAFSVIDGCGWKWWESFSNGTLLHQRPKLVEVVHSTEFTIRDIVLQNSPFWTLHPTYVNNFIASNVTTLAPRPVGNTDGIDPDSVVNGSITDCLVDVGDDGISIKTSVSDVSGLPMPSWNITIRNTTILSRNFAIGSSVIGGISDVLVENCTIGDDSHPVGSSPWAIKIKAPSTHGGYVKNVTFQNITIGNITPNSYQQPSGGTAIQLVQEYGEDGASPASGSPPMYSNISFRYITVAGAVSAGSLTGLNNSNISSLTFDHVVFANVSYGWSCDYVVNTAVIDPVFPSFKPKSCGLP
jgi:polygalacturonase